MLLFVDTELDKSTSEFVIVVDIPVFEGLTWLENSDNPEGDAVADSDDVPEIDEEMIGNEDVPDGDPVADLDEVVGIDETISVSEVVADDENDPVVPEIDEVAAEVADVDEGA